MDIYEGRALKKQLSLLYMAWSLSVIISPFIGGYLQSYFGWRACYVFMLIYTAAILMSAIIILQETVAHKRKLSTQHLYQSVILITKDTIFIRLALSAGILGSMFLVFHSVGTFFIQVTLQYSAIQYGYCSLLIGLSAFVGSLLNYLTINNPLKWHRVCFTLLLIACLMMIVCSLTFQANLTTFLIPCMGIIFSSTYIQTSITAMTLAKKTPYPGTASALLWSFIWACDCLIVFFCSQFNSAHAHVTALFFFGLSLASLCVYLTTKKKAQFHTINATH